ncbi:MAG: Mth938-like domain-containing protein [Gammaproteobacteria bacterium]|nr:Mth938-like domain-containing protein [Gammaproteobacteria bacterium]
MEIVRDFLTESAQPNVRSYESGELNVLGARYSGGVILTPDRVIDNWPPRSAAALEPEDLRPLLELDPPPKTVLIGTGETQVFPPQSCLAPLIEARIGFEVMDTRAACRTWNIMLSENRKVAAALIL